MDRSDASAVDEQHERLLASASLSQCVSVLLQAEGYARDVGSQLEEFAVEIECLRRVGTTESDLRWLICKGYITHLLDVTRGRQFGRKVRNTSSLSFSGSSCFVLSHLGSEFARHMLRTGNSEILSIGELSVSMGEVRPVWNASRRQLMVRRQLIKTFHGKRTQQERILAGFQELGFPETIDDPLPPETNVDSKDRLYKVVYRLRRSLDPPLLYFGCSGSGTSIFWHAAVISPEGARLHRSGLNPEDAARPSGQAARVGKPDVGGKRRNTRSVSSRAMGRKHK